VLGRLVPIGVVGSRFFSFALALCERLLSLLKLLVFALALDASSLRPPLPIIRLECQWRLATAIWRGVIAAA
jgi:hypothetical protein